MGSQTIKGRLTIKVLSATAYNFKFEMSPDGTTWNTVLEGKDTKKQIAAESPGWGGSSMRRAHICTSKARNLARLLPPPTQPFEQRYLAAAMLALPRHSSGSLPACRTTRSRPLLI
jgi:hypothetical protein